MPCDVLVPSHTRQRFCPVHCGALTWTRFHEHYSMFSVVKLFLYCDHSGLWCEATPVPWTLMRHYNPGLNQFLAPSTFWDPVSFFYFLLMVYPAALFSSRSSRWLEIAPSCSPYLLRLILTHSLATVSYSVYIPEAKFSGWKLYRMYAHFSHPVTLKPS